MDQTEKEETHCFFLFLSWIWEKEIQESNPVEEDIFRHEYKFFFFFFGHLVHWTNFIQGLVLNDFFIFYFLFQQLMPDAIFFLLSEILILSNHISYTFLSRPFI